MSWHRKVAWLEGMFIKPQHFQQQDRYVEWTLSSLNAQLQTYGWGVSELEFDEQALMLGNLVLRKCRAVLPDGTVLDLPAEDDVPEPLHIQPEDEGGLIYLGLPMWRAGAKDIDRPELCDPNARHTINAFEAPDITCGSTTLADLDVAGKKVALLSEKDYQHQFVAIAIARVQLVSNQSVTLDKHFISASLNVVQSAPLVSILKEVQGLVRKRSEALASRLKALADGGAAEMADFLLLQLLNKYKGLLDHSLLTSQLHPREVYRMFVEMAGELATFTHPDKTCDQYPEYLHHDLQSTFEAFRPILQHPLSTLLDQSAILIELEEKGYGIRVGYIPQLDVEASFVLCVRADMPNEDLRRLLPVQAKIGPLDSITELVNRQLPGVRIDPLAAVPRQLPFYSGAVYFELDSTGSWWEKISQANSLALHVGDQFPSISLELWAIK